MQVGIGSTQVALPSSRWSALTSTDAANAHTLSHTLPFSNSTIYSTRTMHSTGSSISRRKPKMTFRSPDASTSLALKLSSRPTTTQTTSSVANYVSSPLSSSSTSSSQSSSTTTPSTAKTFLSSSSPSGVNQSTCSFFTPAPPLFKMPLAYPSYHPYSPSQLLLAAHAREENAARRNAAVNAGNINDDKITQSDDIASNVNGRIDLESEARRSSSRTRRPVAKLRDGDGDGNSTQDVSPKDTEPSGTKSPKRKRAGGGGNGSRKKRKEAPVEVQPRRERQRRGAAAAAAAAITESAEAQAAGFDNDAMDVSEPAVTPAPSVDESATNATPEEEEKESDESLAKDSNDAKNARTKRSTRPRRSRAKPANDKEITPTRQTRQSRRRGSSSSGSDATETSAVPNGDAEAPVVTPSDTPVEDVESSSIPANKTVVQDDFNANIDPALLEEGTSNGTGLV